MAALSRLTVRCAQCHCRARRVGGPVRPVFLLSWGRSPKLREFYAVHPEKGLLAPVDCPTDRPFWQFFKLDADNPHVAAARQRFWSLRH
jgi:hypothetical protein